MPFVLSMVSETVGKHISLSLYYYKYFCLLEEFRRHGRVGGRIEGPGGDRGSTRGLTWTLGAPRDQTTNQRYCFGPVHICSSCVTWSSCGFPNNRIWRCF